MPTRLGFDPTRRSPACRHDAIKRVLIFLLFGTKSPPKIVQWGTMARYFFHVIGVDGAFRDEEGRSFPALQDAMAYAAVIAGELSGESENYQGFAVCVADEQGREVARVPIDGDPD